MARLGRLPKGMKSPAVDKTIELLSFWNRALASPNGIKIRAKHPRSLMNMLYKVRSECGHFNYGGLRMTYDDEFVWIVPRDAP